MLRILPASERPPKDLGIGCEIEVWVSIIMLSTEIVGAALFAGPGVMPQI